jgi:hypothetical protein
MRYFLYQPSGFVAAVQLCTHLAISILVSPVKYIGPLKRSGDAAAAAVGFSFASLAASKK